jgi:hypothetical protein
LKIADARGIYYDRSGIASEVARKLAFAGIAIVWIFSGGTPSNVNKVHIEHDLRWAAVLFTAALALDLLQYSWAAAAWGMFSRHKERTLGRGSTEEFGAPNWINYPTIICFSFKLATLAVAFVIVLVFLSRHLL